MKQNTHKVNSKRHATNTGTARASCVSPNEGSSSIMDALAGDSVDATPGFNDGVVPAATAAHLLTLTLATAGAGAGESGACEGVAFMRSTSACTPGLVTNGSDRLRIQKTPVNRKDPTNKKTTGIASAGHAAPE